MPDNIANTPASVTVVFPRADYGDVNTNVRLNSGVRVENHYIVNVPGTGHAGTQVIHSTAIANFTTDTTTPDNDDEISVLAAQIAADFYAWRLASIEIRYESAVAWSMDGAHDVDISQGGTISTYVHRSEWEPEFGELKHAGTFGSSDEPPICGPQVLQLQTGLLLSGTYDALLDISNPSTQAFDAGPAIWGVDLRNTVPVSGASLSDPVLLAHDRYLGTYIGIRPGGNWYASLDDDNVGHDLTDPDFWVVIVPQVSAFRWLFNSTYNPGDVSLSGGALWVALELNTGIKPGGDLDIGVWILATPSNLATEAYDSGTTYQTGNLVTGFVSLIDDNLGNPTSDTSAWEPVEALTENGAGYDPTVSYAAGNFTRELRPAYAFGARVDLCTLIDEADTTILDLTALGMPGSCLKVPNCWITDCGQWYCVTDSGSGSGSAGSGSGSSALCDLPTTVTITGANISGCACVEGSTTTLSTTDNITWTSDAVLSGACSGTYSVTLIYLDGTWSLNISDVSDGFISVTYTIPVSVVCDPLNVVFEGSFPDADCTDATVQWTISA